MDADKLFDSLFPRHKGAFAPFNAGTARWTTAYPLTSAHVRFVLLRTADSLLARSANWRNEQNMFDSPKVWRLILLFQGVRDEIMARAKREKNWQTEKAPYKGFVDRRMTDDELLALDEWQPDAAEIWGLVDDMIQSGWRFMLSYNPRTKLASVTIADDDGTRASGGYMISTADEDGALALKAAVFKHVTLLAGDWSSLLEKPPKARRG